MKLKCAEAEMLAKYFSDRLPKVKGLAGYAFARNSRKLSEDLVDYMNAKTKLFKEYGEEDGDQIRVNREDPRFPEFMEKLRELDEIELDVDLVEIRASDLSELTGEEILVILNLLKED